MNRTPSDRPGTVVVLHAHPDDEAIFTGATIRRLADAGHRVVLVMATDGAEGVPIVPLRRGETMAARRARELEESCVALGVARLVRLGYRDSGMPGDAANSHGRAFMNADVAAEARRLADLIADEDAAALLHYDDNGIYGHPDHLAVHRVGARAASWAGVTAYEGTVDREHLHFVDQHLVSEARDVRTQPWLGRASVEITTAVRASADELVAKRRAMAAHRSQIPADSIDGVGFAATYEHEWYVRVGANALVLEELGNAHLVGTRG